MVYQYSYGISVCRYKIFCSMSIPVYDKNTDFSGVYRPALVCMFVWTADSSNKNLYVTGFAKMCIVHTSTLSTLGIHKIC